MYYIYFINEIKIKLLFQKNNQNVVIVHPLATIYYLFYENLSGFVRRYRLQRKASFSTLTITPTKTTCFC